MSSPYPPSLPRLRGEEPLAPRSQILRQQQWGAWQNWAHENNVVDCPAEIESVMAYFSQMAQLGYRADTIRGIQAAIAAYHVQAGYTNPTRGLAVPELLKLLEANSGLTQPPCAGITSDRFSQIQKIAMRRRRYDKRVEPPEVAERRGKLELALIALMRDTLMRASAVSEIRWNRIRMADDNSGRLIMPTASSSETTVRYISTDTLEHLIAIFPGDKSMDDKIFPWSEKWIRHHIKEAAKFAGLPGRYTGNSPRIGMLLDIMSAGIDIEAIKNIGEWTTFKMPERYLKRIVGDQKRDGGVEIYYGNNSS